MNKIPFSGISNAFWIINWLSILCFKLTIPFTNVYEDNLIEKISHAIFSYIMISIIPALLGIILSLMGYLVNRKTKTLIMNLSMNGVYAIFYIIGFCLLSWISSRE